MDPEATIQVPKIEEVIPDLSNYKESQVQKEIDASAKEIVKENAAPVQEPNIVISEDHKSNEIVAQPYIDIANQAPNNQAPSASAKQNDPFVEQTEVPKEPQNQQKMENSNVKPKEEPKIEKGKACKCIIC